MRQGEIIFFLFLSSIALIVFLFAISRNGKPKLEFWITIFSAISFLLGFIFSFFIIARAPIQDIITESALFISFLSLLASIGLIGFLKDKETGLVTSILAILLVIFPFIMLSL